MYNGGLRDGRSGGVGPRPRPCSSIYHSKVISIRSCVTNIAPLRQRSIISDRDCIFCSYLKPRVTRDSRALTYHKCICICGAIEKGFWYIYYTSTQADSVPFYPLRLRTLRTPRQGDTFVIYRENGNRRCSLTL